MNKLAQIYIFGNGNALSDPGFLYWFSKRRYVNSGREGPPVIVKRIRDVQKGVVDVSGLLGIMLAVEGQREVHYGMPVRNMMYDAIDYMKQMQQLEKENRENKELKGKAEFLSGLKKEDRLLPVFTMVFYYGERQMWDGPMCLHDMLKFPAVLVPPGVNTPCIVWLIFPWPSLLSIDDATASPHSSA